MVKWKLPPPLSDLQSENAYLKELIRQVKFQISQVHKKAAKYEAKYLSALARIKALEEEKPEPKHEPLSPMELASKIAYVFAQSGIRFHIDTPIEKKTSPQQGIQPDGK